MASDQVRTNLFLRRIAEALAIETSGFFAEPAEPQLSHEILELVTAFRGITDPNDRCRCVDFVRTIATGQRVEAP